MTNWIRRILEWPFAMQARAFEIKVDEAITRARQAKWDDRFMARAAHVASWSKDPSTKVGAVIARPDMTTSSEGFNGFPRGVHDSSAWLQDRTIKYPVTVHAELNAILHAKEDLDGQTIYTYPLPPCPRCAAAIIQSGIREVVVPANYVHDGHGTMGQWMESWQLSQAMFDSAGVRVRSVGTSHTADKVYNFLQGI